MAVSAFPHRLLNDQYSSENSSSPADRQKSCGQPKSLADSQKVLKTAKKSCGKDSLVIPGIPSKLKG